MKTWHLNNNSNHYYWSAVSSICQVIVWSSILFFVLGPLVYFAFSLFLFTLNCHWFLHRLRLMQPAKLSLLLNNDGFKHVLNTVCVTLTDLKSLFFYLFVQKPYCVCWLLSTTSSPHVLNKILGTSLCIYFRKIFVFVGFLPS